MPKAKSQSKAKTKKAFDLSNVNPSGRIDVFAASLIDRFAAGVPDLSAFVQQNREMIHAGLNQQLGPHVFNVLPIVQQAKPFIPFIEFAFNRFVQSRSHATPSQPNPTQQGPIHPVEKPKPDYHAILGVRKDATANEIKAAYMKLAKQYHPDLNPGSKDAEERFKDVQGAYDALSVKEKQAA